MSAFGLGLCAGSTWADSLAIGVVSTLCAAAVATTTALTRCGSATVAVAARVRSCICTG